MGIKVNLKNVPVIFVNVFEKGKDSTDNEGKTIPGRYQFTPILDYKDPQYRMLEEKVREYLSGPDGIGSEAAVDKWMSKNFGKENHSDKCAVRDLAERDSELEGFPEGIYFRATSHKPLAKVQTSLGENQAAPNHKAVKGLTVDGDDIEGQEVYSGCIANVSVEFYWHKTWKNLCASALGIRFKDEGQSFGGGGETASDDDLSDDDAPRKSKRRPAEDDEEDEAPRRKRRSYEDDEE